MKSLTSISAIKPAQRLSLSVLLFVIASCSGGSGSDPVVNPVSNTDPTSSLVYTGPEPQTDDVQAFRINLWENIRSDERCGACHINGQQAPEFARSDDVNLAYSAANSLVNLSIPASSRLVTKVAEGHNCWQGNDSAATTACANIIEGYITAWANDSDTGTAQVVQLTAPPLIEPGNSKNFPAAADDTLFGSTVHPLLTSHCAQCHTPDSAIPQTPYFAVDDVQEAYDASLNKIDLETPNNSRFFIRLDREFHNCWSNNCQSDASEMLTQITALADAIETTEPDPNLVLSRALTLNDGILANTGGRFESDIIAKYEFQSGEGSTAFDTSGVAPDLNLTLSGSVDWVGGWGIRLIDGKAQGSSEDSQKLFDLISATGEYSLEAWVAPANVTQGDADDPARIVSYSAGTSARNFTLGQTLYNYEFLNRSTTTNANGSPAMTTDPDTEFAQASLQHVVVTFDSINGRRIYVNGEDTGDVDPVEGGAIGDWDSTFALVVGNEASNDRQWEGVIRMLAIHNRVLEPGQIQQNFDAGVGQKFFMLFSISHLVDTPESYIVFEVSQFDSYAYLFDQPYYVSLESGVSVAPFPIMGMRIGINGREASSGQSYIAVDTNVSASGQTLSELGTVIALEKGAEQDEFFLSFEQIDDQTDVRTPPAVTVLPPVLDGDVASDIGVRTFDEIAASMAAITGVRMAGEPGLQLLFEDIRKALPAIPDLETFLSSQQMAITQLGIGFCDALVDTDASFFGGTNFDAPLSTAQRSNVIDPLVDALLTANPSNQPDRAESAAELDNLFDQLCGNGSSCSASQTRPASKGVCAAALASAAMLVK